MPTPAVAPRSAAKTPAIAPKEPRAVCPAFVKPEVVIMSIAFNTCSSVASVVAALFANCTSEKAVPAPSAAARAIISDIFWLDRFSPSNFCPRLPTIPPNPNANADCKFRVNVLGLLEFVGAAAAGAAKADANGFTLGTTLFDIFYSTYTSHFISPI